MHLSNALFRDTSLLNFLFALRHILSPYCLPTQIFCGPPFRAFFFFFFATYVAYQCVLHRKTFTLRLHYALRCSCCCRFQTSVRTFLRRFEECLVCLFCLLAPSPTDRPAACCLFRPLIFLIRSYGGVLSQSPSLTLILK